MYIPLSSTIFFGFRESLTLNEILMTDVVGQAEEDGRQ